MTNAGDKTTTNAREAGEAGEAAERERGGGSRLGRVGLCAFCGEPGERLVPDRDSATGRLVALLHERCRRKVMRHRQEAAARGLKPLEWARELVGMPESYYRRGARGHGA